MTISLVQKRISQLVLVALVSFMAACAPEDTKDVEADFSGTWACNETTSNPAGTTNFTVNIKKDGSSGNSYKISNFYNLGYSHEALVTISSSSVSLSSQTIGSGNSAYSASGSGTVSSSTKFSMSYKMDDGSGAADNCNATFTKN